jgi:hypothetical protein
MLAISVTDKLTVQDVVKITGQVPDYIMYLDRKTLAQLVQATKDIPELHENLSVAYNLNKKK